MAARNYAPIRALNRSTVRISGSFAPAGTGAVTSTKGKGFSVARSGVGTFTVTFTDKYNDLLSATATVQLAAAADTQAQVGAYSASAKTLVIRTLTAGAAADISANADNRVHFDLVFVNTALTNSGS